MIITYSNGQPEILGIPPAGILWDLLVLLHYAATYPQYRDPWVERVCQNLTPIGARIPGIDRTRIPESEIDRLFGQGELRKWLLEGSRFERPGPPPNPNNLLDSSGDERADLLAQLVIVCQGSPLALQIIETMPLSTIQAFIYQYGEHHRDPKERALEKAAAALEKQLELTPNWGFDPEWLKGQK